MVKGLGLNALPTRKRTLNPKPCCCSTQVAVEDKKEAPAREVSDGVSEQWCMGAGGVGGKNKTP